MIPKRPFGEHSGKPPAQRRAEERTPAPYSFRPRVGIPENVPPERSEPKSPAHTQDAGGFRSADYENLEIEDGSEEEADQPTATTEGYQSTNHADLEIEDDGDEEEDIVPYPKPPTS